MLISKVISGGRAGVERGAQEAALELGFPYGGMATKDRKNEELQVAVKFYEKNVSIMNDNPFIIDWNVVHSDATLIIVRRNNAGLDELEGNSKQAAEFAIRHGKPHLAVFTQDVAKVAEWVKSVASRLGKEDLVLNVAGPRESKAQGIQLLTKIFVRRLLRWFLPWGELTEAEHERQWSVWRLANLRPKIFSTKELQLGIAELKHAKIDYFKKFDGGFIPMYMTDADDINAQVRLGVPFERGNAAKCDYCCRTHLQHAVNSKKVVATCQPCASECPEKNGYLAGFSQVPSLLEAKFLSTAKNILMDVHTAKKSKSLSLMEKIAHRRDEWIVSRTALQKVLDVNNGYVANLEWGIQCSVQSPSFFRPQKISTSMCTEHVKGLWRSCCSSVAVGDWQIDFLIRKWKSETAKA